MSTKAEYQCIQCNLEWMYRLCSLMTSSGNCPSCLYHVRCFWDWQTLSRGLTSSTCNKICSITHQAFEQLLRSHFLQYGPSEKNKGKNSKPKTWASLQKLKQLQVWLLGSKFWSVHTSSLEIFCAATWFNPQVAKFHRPWPSRMLPRRWCLMHHQICNYPSIWKGLRKHANQDAIYLQLPQVLHLCSPPPHVLTRAVHHFPSYIM